MVIVIILIIILIIIIIIIISEFIWHQEPHGLRPFIQD